MDAKVVSQQAVSEAAEVVAGKIDTLLERATDLVLGAPVAGSMQWRQAFAARDTPAGHAALELRARVKIAIAEGASVYLRDEVERLYRTGAFAPPAAPVESPARRSQSRAHRRSIPENQQLTIW
ncbi:hypothetical protein [Rhodococcus sp. NCIMB 12038]|uniref:hypothetical protein n=1 Tax=Rhodococcus sp. NCIMB 12038 TaxID=933800 RepID=UPI000B3D3312|nr:hypothetical protein [Rhodococcus sp. NCIMB 12038]OUS97438.1 hypothetical protein CA951_03595 [Rhodococcus sp. NCIMB 12038]